MDQLKDNLLSAEDAFIDLTPQEIDMIWGGWGQGGLNKDTVSKLVHISTVVPKP